MSGRGTRLGQFRATGVGYQPAGCDRDNKITSPEDRKDREKIVAAATFVTSDASVCIQGIKAKGAVGWSS